MKDPYKTLKIKEDVHARLLSYVSSLQLENGGRRVTMCEGITALLDAAEKNEK